MGKRRRRPWQTSMWVATQGLPRTATHPFYSRLNEILDKADFEGYVEVLCQCFYADEVGRPSLPPGRDFRLLLVVGYFEGLDAERAIAWRAAIVCAARVSGLRAAEAPPDHSAISRTRRLIWKPTEAVFSWILLPSGQNADGTSLAATEITAHLLCNYREHRFNRNGETKFCGGWSRRRKLALGPSNPTPRSETSFS